MHCQTSANIIRIHNHRSKLPRKNRLQAWQDKCIVQQLWQSWKIERSSALISTLSLECCKAPCPMNVQQVAYQCLHTSHMDRYPYMDIHKHMYIESHIYTHIHGHIDTGTHNEYGHVYTCTRKASLWRGIPSSQCWLWTDPCLSVQHQSVHLTNQHHGDSWPEVSIGQCVWGLQFRTQKNKYSHSRFGLRCVLNTWLRTSECVSASHKYGKGFSYSYAILRLHVRQIQESSRVLLYNS